MNANRINTGNGNFDWIAPVYDLLAFAVFGRRLQQAQVVFLNQIPVGATILLIGGGTGWLLEQVLIYRQPRRVVYLEASAQMVARASRRIVRRATLGTVDFRVGDEKNLAADERFDVIITPFVFDLFTRQTLQNHFIPPLRNALKPGGLCLVTDFIKTLVWWQKALLWSMIRFFRLTANIEVRQLTDWQHQLREAGLVRQNHQLQVGGMVASEVWGHRP